MNNIDLNKLKDLAIKAAAGSFPVPVAYEQPRIYSDAEISYLAFAAAVTPAAFLAIVNDLQTEVAAKQQNVDYLADRIPETQHNGMMQLSQQLADAQELLRGTQEKLGKALVRNSEYAGELARRDAAADEPVAWRYRFIGKPGSGPFTSEWKLVTEANYCNPSDCFERQPLYSATQPAGLAASIELAVWYGSMPESNGRANWTAILHRKGQPWSDRPHFTIARSEFPGRALYEADYVRYLIGELEAEPNILAYDSDTHSGYIPPPPPLPAVKLPSCFGVDVRQDGPIRTWRQERVFKVESVKNALNAAGIKWEVNP